MSVLTDDVYRKARRTGLSEEASQLAVYEYGRLKGEHPESSENVLEQGTKVAAMYLQLKATGLTHNEALDEVFLAGYKNELA